MDEKGYATLDDFRGRAVPNVTDWQYLNLNYKTMARIDQDLCIKCGLLPHRLRGHLAPGDRGEQATAGAAIEVIDAECVGCNLCMHVCPVENCITMVQLTERRRPAHRRAGDRLPNWTQHPNNPMAKPAAGIAPAASRVPEPAE